MIKALFFDVGGVLLRTDDRSGRQKWERRFGLPEWGLADLVFNCEASRRAQIGQAEPEEVWAWAAQHLRLNGDELKEMQRDFWAGDRFDEELIGWVASLRPRYRTGIISNAWPDARAFLTSKPFISAAFEHLTLSAEVGVAKPDRRIYLHALAALGVAPPEAIFVDDMPANVEAANAIGMKGIQFVSSAQVRDGLRRLL